jgi:hypothetical protein
MKKFLILLCTMLCLISCGGKDNDEPSEPIPDTMIGRTWSATEGNDHVQLCFSTTNECYLIHEVKNTLTGDKTSYIYMIYKFYNKKDIRFYTKESNEYEFKAKMSNSIIWLYDPDTGSLRHELVLEAK